MSAETLQSFFQTDYLSNAPFVDLIVVQTDDQQLLHPQIQEFLNRERQRSKEICKHDLAHINRSMHNGLVLLDVLQNNKHLPPALAITPTDVTFTLFTHDVGYGSNNVSIRQRYAHGHENESLQKIDMLSQTLPDRHPSREYIYSHYGTIKAGILGTAENYEDLISDMLNNPNQENIFALLISAADKADYFVRERVDHLPPPDISNPYHMLAYAVKNYQLQVDPHERTLTYSVQLYGDTLFRNNKQLWKEYAIENFPQVFKLLDALASLAGYSFVVDIQ